MTEADPLEGRILVLAPVGRDASAICELLRRSGLPSLACGDLPELMAALQAGAGAALMAEEALFGKNTRALMRWVEEQPPWSDMPFIVITSRQTRPEIMLWRHRLLDELHNASLLERPLDALTVSSASHAAVRGRRRQYEVRAYVTERAAAAERLEDLIADRTRELRAANSALRLQMVERERAEDALRQSQKMEAVGQLTGGLAHDFNNMLAGITGSLELMQKRIGQGRIDELGRYLGLAVTSANRAAALTHRLLTFARRQTMSPKAIDANRLIAGMEELIRGTIGPAVGVEMICTPGLWITVCDPNQLESALLNLVINARDAMPDGGTLSVAAENILLDDSYAAQQADVQAGQYVVLSVSDTGTGMPPDVASRAFEPFFTTKPLGLGTGLGLSMVYGFARQSAGHVQICSEAGQGTTIRLYLPRHNGAAALEGVQGNSGTMPRADWGETVLIVDDEPTIRVLVKEVLEELGYAASEAGDAREGLRILQSDQRIDLLVTDVGLPGGMNGRQMADAARQGRPELKVLFITGYAGKAAFGNGRLESGMDVITKPFALHALAAKIRTMIAPPKSG